MKRRLYTWALGLLLMAKGAVAQLAIGQPLPPLTVKTFRNSKEEKINLAVRNGKPLVVVFWSKGCLYSQEFIWSLNGMMKKVPGIETLLVAMDPAEAIQKILDKHPRLGTISLPFAAKDSALFRLFPHQVTPHIAWIGADGRLKAVTSGSEVTTANLQKLKDKGELHLAWKYEYMNDSLYNLRYPLVNAGLLHNNRVAASCLTGELHGVAVGGGMEVNEQAHTLRLRIINASIPQLYAFVFRKIYFFHKARIIIEGLAPAREVDTLLSYELLTPDTSRSRALNFFRQDLDRYLGFNSRLEIRKIKVLVLRQTAAQENFRGEKGKPIDSYLEDGKYKLENVPITAMVDNLFNTASLFPYPVINETGYSGKVSLEFSDRFNDLAAVNKSLESYGLRLVEDWRDMEVIVLRKTADTDPPPGGTNAPGREAVKPR